MKDYEARHHIRMALHHLRNTEPKDKRNEDNREFAIQSLEKVLEAQKG